MSITRRLGHLGQVAFVALAVAACSGGGAPPPAESAGGGFDYWIDAAISEASNGLASQDQLALLNEAAEAGEVSPELQQRATQGFFACLERGGIKYEAEPATRANGVLEYPFTVFGQDTAVADSCMTAELVYVDLVYHMQPSAFAAREQEQLQNRSTLIGCLREYGVVIDDDATVTEVQDALNILFYGADPTETGGAVIEGYIPVDCMMLTGIEAF